MTRRRARRWARVAALLCVAALFPAACGRGGDRTAPATAPPAPTSTGRSSPPPASTVRPLVTLALAGDVHFMKVPGARLARNPETALGPVAAVLRRADVAMVNLETTVTTRGTPQDKHYVFRAPPTAFQALRAAGVDVATMGNNHGMDYGLVGLRDTLAAAAAARFPVVGIGRDAGRAYAPWRVTVRDQRIAILGATQVLEPGLEAAWTAGSRKPGLASAYDEARLTAAVRRARRTADTVVVYLHWGEEGNPCPIGPQRRLAHLLARAGADIVVGTHAHTLQGSGWLGRAYVAYGLGNFYWWNWFSEPNRTTGVLTLTLGTRCSGWHGHRRSSATAPPSRSPVRPLPRPAHALPPHAAAPTSLPPPLEQPGTSATGLRSRAQAALAVEPEVGFEPMTFRLRVGCSASIWMAPDGSSLLTWAASSVQTDTEGSSG